MRSPWFLTPVESPNNYLPLYLGFGVSQVEVNILGFTRIDEQIVFFEHRLSDGKELLKGLQTWVDEASPWKALVVV